LELSPPLTAAMAQSSSPRIGDPDIPNSIGASGFSAEAARSPVRFTVQATHRRSSDRNHFTGFGLPRRAGVEDVILTAPPPARLASDDRGDFANHAVQCGFDRLLRRRRSPQQPMRGKRCR
jgi:hypothetical protein